MGSAMFNLYRIDVNGALARRSACRWVAVAAMAALTFAPTPVFARLSTYMIKSELAHLGFRCLGKVRLRGAIYEVDACDREGRPVVVRVDPDTGKVLRVLRRN
jgi:hypothetical protein